MTTNEPPGGYGESAAPPPPPPPPATPGGPGGYSVGTAWSYGWSKFTQNLGQILIAVIVLVVIQIAINGLGRLVDDNIFLSLVVGLISWIVSLIIGAGLVRAALDITEGKKLDAAQILTPTRLGEVIVASLLTGIATFIGLILCLIPGLVIAFFTSFTLYFLMDRPELGAVDAIKASFHFTKRHAGSVLVWLLLSFATYVVGALLCGVGLLVAIPVILIGTAYTYKTLNNEPVAA